MRNVIRRVPKAHTEMVAATVRTIFAQPDADAARTQLRAVADTLRGRFADVADLLDDAETDLIAYAGFPRPHWRKIWSTKPLERLHRENRTTLRCRRHLTSTTRPSSTSSAPYWPNSTMNGKSPTAATCPKPPWHSSTPPTTMTPTRR